LTIDLLLGEHDRSRSLLLDNHYRTRVKVLIHYRVSGVHLLNLWLLLAHGRGGGGCSHPSVLHLLAAKNRLRLLGLLGLLLGLLVVVLLILSIDWLLR
jgi:hypothetical protein